MSGKPALHDNEASLPPIRFGAPIDKRYVITLHLGGTLLALYLTLPFYKAAVQPYLTVDLTAVIALVCAVVALPSLPAVLGVRARQNRNQHRFIVIWFGLLLLIWLGALFSPDQGLAAQKALVFSLTVLTPLLLVPDVASDEVELSHFLWTVFLVGLAITVTVGLSGLVVIDELDRTSFFGASPIHTATAALMVPAIGFTFIWRRASYLKMIVLLVTPLSLIIAFTSARGPLVSLGLALSLLLVIRSINSLSRITIYLISTVVIVGLFDAFIVDRLPSFGLRRFRGLSDSFRLLSSGERSSIDDASVGARLDLYEVALDMFERAPILGNGTGSFPLETSADPQMSQFEYPHNIILHFAAEYGLLGLTLFIVTTVFACRVVRGICHPAVFGLAAIYLASFFEALISGGLENRLLWGLTFLAIATPIEMYRTLCAPSIRLNM
jgi:O-antigen ligase